MHQPAAGDARRIATTIATATPTPISRSPMLNTFVKGIHSGMAKMSVSGARTASSTIALFEYVVASTWPAAAAAAGLDGMYPPFATIASRFEIAPSATSAIPAIRMLRMTTARTIAVDPT